MKVEWWQFPNYQSIEINKSLLKKIGINLSRKKPLYKLRAFIFWKGRTSVGGLKKLGKQFKKKFSELSKIVKGLHQHGGGFIELPYRPNIYSYAIFCHYFFDMSKWEVSYSQNAIGIKVKNKENIERFQKIMNRAFPNLKLRKYERKRGVALVQRIYTSRILRNLFNIAYGKFPRVRNKKEAIVYLSCLLVDEGSIDDNGTIVIKVKDKFVIDAAKKAFKILNIKISKVKQDKEGLYKLIINSRGVLKLAKMFKEFLLKYPEVNLGSKQKRFEEIHAYIRKLIKNKRKHSYCTKFKILYFLKERGKTIKDIIFKFMISPAAVLRHLKDLEKLKLISKQKISRKNFYTLTRFGREVVKNKILIGKISFDNKKYRIYLAIKGKGKICKHRESVFLNNAKEKVKITSYLPNLLIINSKRILEKLEKDFQNGEIIKIKVKRYKIPKITLIPLI
jgi:DNA-binding MarR family transcriptional regulator